MKVVSVGFWLNVVSTRWSCSGDDEGGLKLISEDVEVLEIMVVVLGAQRSQNWPVGCILHVRLVKLG